MSAPSDSLSIGIRETGFTWHAVATTVAFAVISLGASAVAVAITVAVSVAAVSIAVAVSVSVAITAAVSVSITAAPVTATAAIIGMRHINNERSARRCNQYESSRETQYP